MNYEIEIFKPNLKEEWDIFVNDAKNATFLFRRDYMDYHADRFEDFSLIARNSKGDIVALLPANRETDTLVSHGGLTYGGWIGHYRHFDILALLEIQRLANEFLISEGFKHLIYKPIPYIYTSIPADEDRYMLFRNNAQLIGCQISSAINLHSEAGPDKSQLRKFKAASNAGLSVSQTNDFSYFWKILTELLTRRYSTIPVHSLEEIELLSMRFPDNIQLFTVQNNKGETVAGTVMYLCGNVAHSQYIAASAEGKEANALVLLFNTLIEKYRSEGYHWFDFGISTENRGTYLNEGLVRQKLSFGGRGINYDIYKIDLK